MTARAYISLSTCSYDLVTRESKYNYRIIFFSEVRLAWSYTRIYIDGEDIVCTWETVCGVCLQRDDACTCGHSKFNFHCARASCKNSPRHVHILHTSRNSFSLSLSLYMYIKPCAWTLVTSCRSNLMLHKPRGSSFALSSGEFMTSASGDSLFLVLMNVRRLMELFSRTAPRISQVGRNARIFNSNYYTNKCKRLHRYFLQ